MTGLDAHVSLFLGALTLVVGFIWRFVMPASRPRAYLVSVLIFCAIAGAAPFAIYGKANQVVKVDGAKRLLHIHDFAHYYLGSKYFPEMGYKGIYYSIGLALQELSGDNRVTFNSRILQIADLEKKGTVLTGNAIVEGGLRYRNRFTQARWAEFKSDIAYLTKKVPAFAWQAFLIDAGYNPSPVYTLYGRIVSNLLPLDPFLFLLSTLDLLLLCLVVLAFWRFAGVAPALLVLCAFLYFPGGSFATLNWTGGSFLRFPWLLWLTLSLLFFSREKFLLSGVCFGFCSAERIFPLFFFLAALWYLAGRLYAEWKSRTKSDRAAGDAASPLLAKRQIIALCSGLVVSSLSLVALTSLLYGAESWTAFTQHILAHSKQFYMNSIAFKKAGVYTPDIVDSVRSPDIASRVATWFRVQELRWEMWTFNKVFLVPFLALGATAALRLNGALCALLLGSFLLYSLTLAFHYYYCYLALIFGFLLMPGVAPAGVAGADSRHLPLIYASLSFYLIASNIFFLYDTNPIEVCFVASLLFLVFLLVASLGVLVRPRNAAVAVLGICAIAGAVGMQRQRPLESTQPPLALEMSGTVVKFDAPQGSRTRTIRHPDTYGYSVLDRGRVLRTGGSLHATVTHEESRDRTLLVRLETFYPGILTVTVNGSWRVEAPLAELGTFFDYSRLRIPQAVLRQGTNDIQLQWFGANAVGVYSTWLL